MLGITAVWWLLAPLQVDDGWVRGRQVNSLVSGGFSNYYDDYGANLPLATWYEWVQHFVMTGTDSLAVHRLFSAVFVVATWFVARWCLVELTGRRPSRSDATWWVAAAVFGIGATAFGMTLRPEPMPSRSWSSRSSRAAFAICGPLRSRTARRRDVARWPCPDDSPGRSGCPRTPVRLPAPGDR